MKFQFSDEKKNFLKQAKVGKLRIIDERNLLESYMFIISYIPTFKYNLSNKIILYLYIYKLFFILAYLIESILISRIKIFRIKF